MKIKLWKYFLKQRNSTLQATDDWTHIELEGYLNDSCSVLSPEINFEYSGTDIQTYNYAYIEEYKRYYFVDNWTTNYNLWTASMSVDVMGTYKYDLLGSKQYVVRCYSFKTTELTDTMYPTLNNSTIENISPLNNAIAFGGEGGATPYSSFARTAFAGGYVVVGVTGATATTTGVTYYMMPCSSAGFGKLISGLYQISPSSFGDIGSGLAKQLANPIQYITSVYWYPRVVDTLLEFTTQSIPLGYYSVSSVYCAVCDPVYIAQIENVLRFNLTDHSQIDEYGEYLNFEPYSQYYFSFMPFGTFKINPDLFMGSKLLRLHFRNDVTTGQAEFTLYASKDDMRDWATIVYKGCCTTGIELPLTQTTTDYSGGVGSVIGALGSAALGNIAGAASGIISAGLSFAGAGNELSSKGSFGGVVNWDLDPQVQIKRYRIAGSAPKIYGYPFCQYMKLSSFSGYVKCENAIIDDFLKAGQGALITEYEQVIDYLNNGFYIE